MPRVLKTTGLKIHRPASRHLPKLIFGNARLVVKPSTDQAHLRTANVERRSEYVADMNKLWKKTDEGGKGYAPSAPASALCVGDGYVKVYKRRYIAPGKYIVDYRACPGNMFFKYLSKVSEAVAAKREKLGLKVAERVGEKKSASEVKELTKEAKELIEELRGKISK
jgi:hypothetical protein